MWDGSELQHLLNCHLNICHSSSDGKEYACNAGDLGSVLGWDDPLEKGMATLSRFLAWRIPWREEPRGLYSPWIHKKLDTNEWLTLSLSDNIVLHLWLWRAIAVQLLEEIISKSTWNWRKTLGTMDAQREESRHEGEKGMIPPNFNRVQPLETNLSL